MKIGEDRVGVGLGIGTIVGGTILAGRLLHGGLQRKLKPINPDSLRGWDYDMELRYLDGRYVYGTSFGGRVVFLNFWATWYAPCVAELPSIERLMGSGVDAGVAFACITGEEPEKVRVFLKAKGALYLDQFAH